MGRFDELYTEPQRQAVGRAMLEPDPLTGKRLTAKQAVAALNSGALNCPPPPKPMPVTTAYWCRDRERQRQQGHSLSPAAKQALEDPKAVELKLTQRLLSIHERNIDELEQQRLKGTPDSRLFGMVVKNHREIMASIRPPGRPHKPGHKSIPPQPASEPDTVNDLVLAHEQSKRGSSQHTGTAHNGTHTANGTETEHIGPDSRVTDTGDKDRAQATDPVALHA